MNMPAQWPPPVTDCTGAPSITTQALSSDELNRASTEARVPGARLDRLDLRGCICQSKDIRIRCIA